MVRQQMGFAPRSTAAWLLAAVLPNPGADLIFVTQDDTPVLLAVSQGPMPVAVHDARSGEPVGEVAEAGLAATLVFGP
jgi:hypothetical protein